jgi:hypothetical protein
VGRRLGLGAALLAAIAAVWGGGLARADRITVIFPKGPDPAVREWPSWPSQVSCGGLDFDPVIGFGGPTEAELGTGAAEQALAGYLEKLKTFTTISPHYWRVVAATPTQVEFAQGRLDAEPVFIEMELAGGEWKPVGKPRGCVPRSVREGSEAAGWRIDGSQEPASGTRRIKVDLRAGSGCDGGRSLNDAVQRIAFRQLGGRLVMTIWLEPLPPGVYTCEKLIEPPLVVKLPGRLGKRSLYDGAAYPPRLRK